MDKVAVYIADQDAQKFLLFNEHYEPFTIMLENGVFDVRNGSVVMHFDHLGTLQVINRADVLYSRKHHL